MKGIEVLEDRTSQVLECAELSESKHSKCISSQSSNQVQDRIETCSLLHIHEFSSTYTQTGKTKKEGSFSYLGYCLQSSSDLHSSPRPSLPACAILAAGFCRQAQKVMLKPTEFGGSHPRARLIHGTASSQTTKCLQGIVFTCSPSWQLLRLFSAQPRNSHPLLVSLHQDVHADCLQAQAVCAVCCYC